MIARLFAALAAACGALAADAIVIRHDVRDASYRAIAEEHPAVFALNRTQLGHRDCIATVIAARWAVTAAHCTQSRALAAALAAGSAGYPVEIGGVTHHIDRVVRHPESAITRPVSPRWTDIALVRFARAVTHVTPVALYEGTDEVGQIVLIPGWGDHGNGVAGIVAADGLFRVAENRIDTADDHYLSFRFDDPRAAAGALPREGISGPGDSGGPALIRNSRGWVTLGVSSHQRTFGGAQGRYGVVERYVRISAQVPWIRRQIAADADRVRRRAGEGTFEPLVDHGARGHCQTYENLAR